MGKTIDGTGFAKEPQAEGLGSTQVKPQGAGDGAGMGEGGKGPSLAKGNRTSDGK